jgi:hypothetical protein
LAPLNSLTPITKTRTFGWVFVYVYHSGFPHPIKT